MQFYDIAGPDETGPLLRAFNVDLPPALERMHAIDGDGNLHTGAGAFVAMWACLPYFCHVARFAKIPGIPQVLEFGYTYWSKLRLLITGRSQTHAKGLSGASCRVSPKGGKKGSNCD